MEKYTDLMKAALDNLKITSLKPMQAATLDAFLTNDDIVLLSPTGSGKTVAFLLPILGMLNPEEKGVQTLVIAPSRELALQIERVFRDMSTGFKVTCCYGGHAIHLEKNSLQVPPAVLIGTPGRILDHMERGSFDASSIRTLVLDEFDKSLEMGFTEEMSAIIERLPGLTKRVLTSATDAEIPEYTGLTNPFRIDYLEGKKLVSGLTLKKVLSPEKDKLETLYKLLCETGAGQKLVFCNQRESVERVSNFLYEKNVPNAMFHGGMEQPERERSLIKLRNGSANVFVSTDLAARGLDIPEIKHVIHYHIPINEEAFIHRNGRTARMNAEGSAFILLGPTEFMPEYVNPETEELVLSEQTPAMEQPDWITVYIGRGKKAKLSKGDIVGFLIQQGGLEKSDVGMIEVKEFHSYVAVRKASMQGLFKTIKDLKIKNMKTKFALSL